MLSQGNNTLIRLGNSLYTVVDNVNHIVRKVNTSILNSNTTLSTVETLPSISSVNVGSSYILKSDPTTVFTVTATEYGYAYAPSHIQSNTGIADYSLSLWDITHLVTDTFLLSAKSSLTAGSRFNTYVLPSTPILDSLVCFVSTFTLLITPSLKTNVTLFSDSNRTLRQKELVIGNYTRVVNVSSIVTSVALRHPITNFNLSKGVFVVIPIS